MKSKTLREQVKAVAQRWRINYGRNEWLGDSAKQQIQTKLDNIDVEIASEKDVEKIIGNNSWVFAKTCNECGNPNWNSVEFAERRDYGTRTAIICIDCLRKAITLLENEL